MVIPLWSPPVVQVEITFEFSVSFKFGVVLDTKGIREAIEQKNPAKALNSLALKVSFLTGLWCIYLWDTVCIRSFFCSLLTCATLFAILQDTFDGVDLPMVTLTAGRWLIQVTSRLICFVELRSLGGPHMVSNLANNSCYFHTLVVASCPRCFCRGGCLWRNWWVTFTG